MPRPRKIDNPHPWCIHNGRYGFSKDKDGWWVCGECRKPSIHTMNECDTCGKKYRAYKQNLKFAVTCPQCD